MPSSKSKQSVRSPISDVPYDVLLDITCHCLPQHPLEVRQPNATIAPMLLCQICSSWRTFAFASPTLWSHLSYSLTVQDIDEELGSFAFLQNEIEFILWWKKNQGSMAPFLRLDIEIDDDKLGVPLAGDGMAFILKYVTTAQYLEIDPIFWERVEEKFKIGDEVTFPNLHTLVTHNSNYTINHSFYDTQVLIGLIPTYSPSALRRLALVKDVLDTDIAIPSHWSTLTHLLITSFHPTLDFWVSLTSAIPCLQWIYIAFDIAFHREEYRKPMRRSLPQLSSLFIQSGGDDNFQFGSLFKNLHLPVLNTLWLSSRVREWWNHRGISDIYTVLLSTPTIRQLTLRKTHQLSSAEIDYSTGTLGAIGGVAPIWSPASHLAHLRLDFRSPSDFSQSEVENELDIFFRSAFFSNNHWLDLDNAACSIKKITVIDRKYSSHEADSNNHFTTSSIRKYVGNTSNITIDIISEPYIDFEESWMEWRSSY